MQPLHYYLSVVNPETKQVERLAMRGDQLLTVLHKVRKLGLNGVVIKAAHRWAGSYPVFYTLDGRNRVKRVDRFTKVDVFGLAQR